MRRAPVAPGAVAADDPDFSRPVPGDTAPDLDGRAERLDSIVRLRTGRAAELQPGCPPARLAVLHGIPGVEDAGAAASQGREPVPAGRKAGFQTDSMAPRDGRAGADASSFPSLVRTIVPMRGVFYRRAMPADLPVPAARSSSGRGSWLSSSRDGRRGHATARAATRNRAGRQYPHGRRRFVDVHCRRDPHPGRRWCFLKPSRHGCEVRDSVRTDAAGLAAQFHGRARAVRRRTCE